MIIDKNLEDEVLVLQDLGIQIDIAALIEDINSSRGRYFICECETDVLMGFNLTDGINVEAFKTINEARLNQPVLVSSVKGYMWIIDGNHRLIKRWKLGKKFTRYILINSTQLDSFASVFSWR